MSRIIEIKKSAVAMLKGLNKTAEQIAAHFGVTEKEMKEVLTTFGFIKTRKPKNYVEPEYVIETVNDVVEEPETQVTNTQDTDNQVVTEVENVEESEEMSLSDQN